MFELLNEPHGKLDAAGWNALLAEMLAIVRRTNPTRTIVIGPTQWNSLAELRSLELPANDRNILVTFHYYEPFRFTHQGASWAEAHRRPRRHLGQRRGPRPARRGLRPRPRLVAPRTGRPVLLGEFGAYDSSGTPIELRAAYTAAVAPRRRSARLPLGLLAVRQRLHRLGHEDEPLGRPIKDALDPGRRWSQSCRP